MKHMPLASFKAGEISDKWFPPEFLTPMPISKVEITAKQVYEDSIALQNKYNKYVENMYFKSEYIKHVLPPGEYYTTVSADTIELYAKERLQPEVKRKTVREILKTENLWCQRHLAYERYAGTARCLLGALMHKYGLSNADQGLTNNSFMRDVYAVANYIDPGYRTQLNPFQTITNWNDDNNREFSHITELLKKVDV